MKVTVQRYRGPRVYEKKDVEDKRGAVHRLVEQLTALWGEEGRTKAVNVAWWRYRHHLSLQVRKVLP